MSMDEDPPRLLDDPELGEAMRLLVSDEPPPSIDARITSAITAASGQPRFFSWSRLMVGMTVIATLGMIAWKLWRQIERPPSNTVLPTAEAFAHPSSSEAPSLDRAPAPPPITSAAHMEETTRGEPPSLALEEQTTIQASPNQRIARPSEEQLIIEARRALATNPSRAQSRLSLHRRLYPDGVLAEEREALIVELLIQEGHLERARRSLDQIRRNHPGSAHVTRLERLLDTM